jgi:hypothetical protein
MPKSTPPVPVEHKVITMTLFAQIVAFVLQLANGLVGNSALMGSLPGTVQAVIFEAIPILTFLVGFLTSHTDRGMFAEARASYNPRSTTDLTIPPFERVSDVGDFDAEAAAYHAGDV